MRCIQGVASNERSRIESAVIFRVIVYTDSVDHFHCKPVSECLLDGSAGWNWIESSMYNNHKAVTVVTSDQTDCMRVDVRLFSDIISPFCVQSRVPCSRSYDVVLQCQTEKSWNR